MIFPAAISLHGFENVLLGFCGVAILIGVILIWMIWKRG